MAPAAPTPQQLYARLRELWPDLSEENVARKLDIGLKNFQRLRQGHGPNWKYAIHLLQAAGWIRVGEGEDVRARQFEIASVLRQLTLLVEAQADAQERERDVQASMRRR